MYNTTLLEDFEEDSRTRTAAKFPTPQDESGANEPKNELAEPKEEEAPVEVESWSDDPVRMYLTQMGEIPLLTRQEEIRLAKRIEDTRQQFSRSVAGV